MLAEERLARIESYLQRVEIASLEELAREVGASVSTVRRDVSQLAEAGIVRRTHGGARILQPRSQPKADEYIFSSRLDQQAEEKAAIARACAGLLRPNQTVILDAGSTVLHVARELIETPLQIITNSLPVANLYASSSLSEVIVCGGVIYPKLGVLVGPHAVDTFRRAHADVAIMGAGGLAEGRIYNSHALLIDMQQAMIDAAERVIFCLDSTKFNRRTLYPLCEVGRIHTIITDENAPTELVDSLRGASVEVILAATVPAPTARR